MERQRDAARARGTPAVGLKEVLDTLNHLGFPAPFLKADDCSAMVAAMCDPALCASLEPAVRGKMCKFVVLLCNRQHAVFSAASLAVALETLLAFSSGAAPNDALRGLSAVLQSHAPRCTQQYDAIVALLVRLSHPTEARSRTRQLAVGCIAVLCEKARHRAKAHHPVLFAHLVAVISVQIGATVGGGGAGGGGALSAAEMDASSAEESERFAAGATVKAAAAAAAPATPKSSLRRLDVRSNSTRNRLLSAATLALERIALDSNKIHGPSTAKLVRLMLTLFAHGKSGERGAAAAEVAVGLALTPSTPRRDASGLAPSVAERSDDGEQDLDAKVRSHALRYVAAIGSATPKLLHNQWTHGALFQDDGTASTLTLLTGDSCRWVRAAAADALAALYAAAPLRSWIPLALERSSPASTRSFVPASVAVAHSAVRTHAAVVRALRSEAVPTTRVRVLKCAVAVAKATPYEKLAGFVPGPPIATALLDGIVAHLGNTADATIHFEAVLSVAALLRVEALAAHMAPRLILEPTTVADSADDAAAPRSLLLRDLLAFAKDIALAHLRPDAVTRESRGWGLTPAVTLQRAVVAIGAVAAASTFHPERVAEAWPAVHELLLHALSSREDQMRSAAVALIDTWIQGASGSCAGALTQRASSLAAMVALDGWTHVVGSQVLQRGFRDPSAKVRAAVCQCVQGIPAPVWRALPSAVRSACAACVVEALSDKNKRVRPAACGALAFWSKLPLSVAVADGGEESLSPAGSPAPPPRAIKTLMLAMANDANLMVRARAAWALANWVERLFGDIFFGVRSSSISSSSDAALSAAEVRALHALFPLQDVGAEELARALIAAMRGHEKLRSSSARALGFVSAWLLSEMAGWSPSPGIAPFDPTFDSVVECLCELAAGGSVGASATRGKPSALHPKIQWSASYALGVLLRSTGRIGSGRRGERMHDVLFRWRTHLARIVDVLCSAAGTSANSKVRIAAAKAIAHAVSAERIVSDAVVPLGDAGGAAHRRAFGPCGVRCLTLLFDAIRTLDDDANASFNQFQYRDRFEEVLWGSIAGSLRGFAAFAADADAEEEAAVAAADAGEDADLARVRVKASTFSGGERVDVVALAAIAAPAARRFFDGVDPSKLGVFCAKCERKTPAETAHAAALENEGGDAGIKAADVAFLRAVAARAAVAKRADRHD